jgi:S1-C subfamily serine protease
VSPRAAAPAAAAAAIRAAAPAVAAAALLAGCGAGDAATAPAPSGRAAAAVPLVLKVQVPGATRGAGDDATAFAVGGGRAVTVAHVLRPHHPVYVAGRRARVLHVDRRLDVAVLAVRGLRAPALLGGSAHAGERTRVRVLRSGAARSVRATVRRSITARMTGFGGPVQVRPALELAAAIMPGDSGAPVLDGRGRLVGMVFAEASDSEALAYALDARAFGSMVDSEKSLPGNDFSESTR